MTVEEYLHAGIDRALRDWRGGFVTDGELIVVFQRLAAAYIADVESTAAH